VTPSSPTGAIPITTFPFIKEGVGEFTYVFSGTLNYFNSWQMTTLEINGVDYTNKWSNTLPPPAADGKYYIRYVGAFDWSHFELFGSP
jgi:endoglucanase